MNESPVFFAPTAYRSNVLLCAPETPFDPVDLANMFEKGIVSQDARGVSPIGTITVEHWRIEDIGLQALETDNWGTTRTVEDFDKRDMTENLPVVVFHTAVDPVTRVCQSCGRTAGTPRGR